MTPEAQPMMPQAQPMTAEAQPLTLASGRSCMLVWRPHLMYRQHYVIYFPASQGECSEAEKDEMLVLSRRKASELGLRHHGDPECYTVIHNGLASARVRNPHFHIVPVRSRREKALIYLVLGMKNLLSSLKPSFRGMG